MSSRNTSSRSYERIAWFYEKLAHIYSLGQIKAAKLSQVDIMSPGDRVLYVGVGSGEDALAAARKGAQVTCVDLSAAMLRRVQKRFDVEGLCGEFFCSDVMKFSVAPPRELYDIVCANFFLNIFSREIMHDVLRHIALLVRPGGRLCIADFAPSPAESSKTVIFIHGLHYLVAESFFWALGLYPLHPIYDYSKLFPSLNVRLERRRDFPLTQWGPCSYCIWIGRRLDEVQAP